MAIVNNICIFRLHFCHAYTNGGIDYSKQKITMKQKEVETSVGFQKMLKTIIKLKKIQRVGITWIY